MHSGYYKSGAGYQPRQPNGVASPHQNGVTSPRSGYANTTNNGYSNVSGATSPHRYTNTSYQNGTASSSNGYNTTRPKYYTPTYNRYPKKKTQHYTVLGYLLKLKYHAYCENWKDFVAITNYALCSFSSLIVEIMDIAKSHNIPSTILARIHSTWNAELDFLKCHLTRYKVATGVLEPDYKIPTVPQQPLVYRDGLLPTVVDVLPFITYALDSSTNRLSIYNDIYKYQQQHFENAKISDLPDCIESYYLLRKHHKLDACKMLRRIYWTARTRMIVDFDDISIILYLCKWYDIIFDFVCTNRKRVTIYCDNDDMYNVDHDVATIVRKICR